MSQDLGRVCSGGAEKLQGCGREASTEGDGPTDQASDGYSLGAGEP
jgi:hypothetical protein